jgi:hypothetical protein
MSCQNCNTDPVPCNSGCTGCGNKCHEVVDSYADVQEFRNAFVTVRDENAVYHVDEVGNPVAVSRSPIYKDHFVATVGAYKQNIVWDFAEGKFYVYDPDGAYKTGTIT